MLRVGCGAAGEEVPVEAARWLADVENAIEVFPVQLLAVEELGHGLHLLPGLRRTPFSAATVRRPFATEILIREDVGAVIEGVAVAVDRHAIRFAIPGPNRSLEQPDIVAHVDLFGDPIWHGG